MRGTVRTVRLVVAFVVAAALSVLAVGGASASGTVTIGQVTNPVGTACDADVYQLQTAVASGTSYEVPAGNWTLTDWSTKATFGSMSVVVFRPIGGGSYQVVGQSAVEALPEADGVSTFSASIAVQGGDLLGVYIATATDYCGESTLDFAGDITPTAFAGGPLTTGQIVTPPVSGGWRISISATLTPAVDAQQQLSALAVAVTGVGSGTSLADKVKLIQSYVAANKTADACSALNAFLNQVKAQTGKKLTAADALSFTTQANAIKTTLGC
jgi:hypothetical protein